MGACLIAATPVFIGARISNSLFGTQYCVSDSRDQSQDCLDVESQDETQEEQSYLVASSSSIQTETEAATHTDETVRKFNARLASGIRRS